MSEGLERLGPRSWRTTDRTGRVLNLREITPEDAPALQRVFAEQDPADRKLRLLSAIDRLPDRLALRFCTVDGVRDFCLVWTPEDDPKRLSGGARLMRDRDPASAEFAVSVASGMKGNGLGRKALEAVMVLGAENGIERVWGTISTVNTPMRRLARKLGMRERSGPEEFSLVIAEKTLDAAL